MATQVDAHPQSVMIADLARSGLTDKDARRLKLKVLTSEEMAELGGANKNIRVRAVEFPYFGVDGQDTGTRRYRLMDDTRSFGQKGKAQRYWQPPNTLPRAYLPQLIDWRKVADDPSIEVWITEGEKKAAKACKEGIACMALGGVYSFTSKKHGMALVNDMAAFPWKGRTVKICFDTDPVLNPMVETAQLTLTRRLEHKGGKVLVVKLPLLPGAQKTGLDDFLVAKGKKTLLKLEAKQQEANVAFAQLNKELALIDNPACIYHVKTGQLFSDYKPLTQFLYGGLTVMAPDPTGNIREINAVPEWAKWDGARRCERLVFEPGGEQITEANEFNLWKGWPYEPKAGDVAPFKKLFDYHCAGLTKEDKKWFLQWIAYQFQHPGAKLYSAVVLWSAGQGTGKTAFGETIGRLFGASFSVVTEAELHSAFNAWECNKQFILGEEITGSERRADANRIKFMVTSNTVLVNQKYQVTYQIKSCANFLFVSNHFNAFLLDKEDRRFFIVETDKDPEERPSVKWFTKIYDPWARSDEGCAALMYYLLKVDLDGFNPLGKAPHTSAKADMVAASNTEVEAYIADVVGNPDQYLKIGEAAIQKDLYTTTELISLLDADRRYNLRIQNLSNALKKAGVAKLERTRVGNTGGGVYLWAIRNQEKWLVASHGDRAGHYLGASEEKPPKF